MLILLDERFARPVRLRKSRTRRPGDDGTRFSCDDHARAFSDTHSFAQSGRYDLASDTGALSRIVARLREMNTSTTIVARYGSDDRNCDAIEIPAPCAKNCAMVT